MYKSKNKYISRSRISEKKTREIMKYYSQDMTAVQISNLTGLPRITINRMLNNVRKKIAKYCENKSEFIGEIECDESYFGGKRKGDKRGRGVTNKVPVFGLLKRDGKVYTQVIKNASSKELMPIIKDLVNKNSTVYTDKWKAYDGLVLDGYKHKRINHSRLFAEKQNHINGIENFWGWSKERLRKFKGINRNNFYLHLKECEFRFNYRKDNLYKKILEVLIQF